MVVPARALAAPDLAEPRDGRWLLVWGGVPAWAVVDDEVHAALAGREPLPPQLHAELAALTAGPPASDPDPLRLDSIAVNLTRACPLACRMCYERGRPAGPGSGLDAGSLTAALRALKPCCGPRATLALLGGEPLLVPELLFASADCARDLGLAASVATSGEGLDAGLCRRLRGSGLRVQVSLDGATAATHEANRGPGTFARAVAAARRLVDAGIPLELALVVHRGNLAELPAFFDLAALLGAQRARFLPLKAIGGGREGGLQPVPLPELLAAAVRLFEERPARARLAGSDALSILVRQCRRGTPRHSCGAGRRTLLIDADGTLHPCLNLARAGLAWGTVAEAPDLARRWRESATLAAWRAASDLATGACRACPVRHWCLGGCRGEVLAGGGGPGDRSADCAERRRAVLDTLWLIARAPAWLA